MMTDEELAAQIAKHRQSSTETIRAREAIARVVRTLASDPIPDVPDKSDDWRAGYRAGLVAMSFVVDGFVEEANAP